MRKFYLLATALVVLLVLSKLGYELWYWKRAYPGVMVLGQNMDRRTAGEIETVIRQEMRNQREIVLKWEGQEWKIETQEFELSYDAELTAIAAIQSGRDGRPTTDVAVVYSMSENKLRQLLSGIIEAIEIPAQEPEIAIDRSKHEVLVTPGENGQIVDERALVEMIRRRLADANEGQISVPVVPVEPKLNEEKLAMAEAAAQKLIDKRVELVHQPSGQRWEVGDEQLVAWLDPAGAMPAWKEAEIEAWVVELAKNVDRPAQNASFRFVGNGRVEEFKPAAPGWRLDTEELKNTMVGTLSELAVQGSTASIDLPTETLEPTVVNSEVNTLGIKELIGRGESWFSGSITNRIFNLRRAAEVLSGVLVAPGETFSFNEAVGEISSATGYKSAYIIKDGKTILGDGGGVCQTSSTLFRAILAAGLPIEERTAHAYRVSYYEQNYQVGFDATVFQPAPDFKFKNDTPAYVLIQMDFDEKKKYLSFSLYGTSDGRVAEVSKARVWDVTAPAPDLYIDDGNLPIGQVVQTEHKANGAKVAFDWKVTRGEEVLQERTFFSSYRPWQAVYLRGTKTN